jgi:hypothetical protein
VLKGEREAQIQGFYLTKFRTGQRPHLFKICSLQSSSLLKLFEGLTDRANLLSYVCIKGFLNTTVAGSRTLKTSGVPPPAFSVKRGGKQVQAILSASWMQKQLMAHKFTMGWEIGTITKMEVQEHGEDDGEMEW